MSAVAESLPSARRATSPARRASLRRLIVDLAGYGLVSAVALALDWGLLVGLIRAGVYYEIAAAISFTAGMLVAYLGSVALVFNDRRQRSLAAEALGFVAIGVAGLACNQALLFAFVHFGGLNVALAKAPTAACVFGFNFFARRTLLFATARQLA